MVKKYIFYLIRWQLSTPIIWLVVKNLGTGIIATIIANLIGGLIFFWIDRVIFGSKKKKHHKIIKTKASSIQPICIPDI